MTEHALPAALQRLKAFELRGAGNVTEEQPGVLSEICQHLTRLRLHGESLDCVPVSSTTLQSLSIICSQTHTLPGSEHPWCMSLSKVSSAHQICTCVCGEILTDVWQALSVPAAGYCPQLRTLVHSARDVTAAQLLGLPKLTTLRDFICSPTDISPTFVTGLRPLRHLQHIQLSQ